MLLDHPSLLAWKARRAALDKPKPKQPFRIGAQASLDFTTLTARQRNTVNALRACQMERTRPRMHAVERLQHAEMQRAGFMKMCDFPMLGASVYASTTRFAVVGSESIAFLVKPAPDYPVRMPSIYEQMRA